MKKANKGILLVTSLMLLACSNDVHTQQQVSADEAAAIGLSIYELVKCFEVAMPDEYFLSCIVSGEAIYAEKKTKEVYSMNREITLGYSKSKSVGYYHYVESSSYNGEITEITSKEQWLEFNNKTTYVYTIYFENDSPDETDALIYDSDLTSEIQYNFTELNDEGLSMLSVFGYKDELGDTDDGVIETWESYYGSDNLSSIQVEEKYVCESEYIEPNHEQRIKETISIDRSCNIKDLIMMDGYMSNRTLSMSLDSNKISDECFEGFYKLENSIKNMPKLNKSDFPTPISKN